MVVVAFTICKSPPSTTTACSTAITWWCRVSGPLEGVFVKGYAGGGAITKGTMIDEDFPPLTVPYSSTSSDILGHLSYASIDAGFTFLDNTRRLCERRRAAINIARLPELLR
jgi:hypothetical protein